MGRRGSAPPGRRGELGGGNLAGAGDEDRAGAALTLGAALLGSGEALVAQPGPERGTGRAEGRDADREQRQLHGEGAGLDLLEVRALLEGEAARLAALRGTEADFVLLARRYEEMLASHEETQPIDPREHARRDHAFHRAISEASHNPVLVHTLQSLNELLLSTVFASVNNLYHRPPQKRQIDRQHARLYAALRERQPDQAQRAAREHIHSIRDNLREIEQEEQRLVRATLRLNGWG